MSRPTLRALAGSPGGRPSVVAGLTGLVGLPGPTAPPQLPLLPVHEQIRGRAYYQDSAAATVPAAAEQAR